MSLTTQAVPDTEAPPASRPPAAPPSPSRALTGVVLKSERDWPARTVLLVQLGVLGLLLALWEIGVRAGLINHFFWSMPSDIVATSRRRDKRRNPSPTSPIPLSAGTSSTATWS